jgi:transcriptional regulator
MYIPAAFAETDLAKLHDFIEQNHFALLISQLDGRPFATHLPLLLDRKMGAYGCLIGHMARANPQWVEAAGKEVLIVFSGPHVYISPTWYEADQVVPTWNYVAVHAYGRLRIIEDRKSLTDMVQELVQAHEQALPRPWRFKESETFTQRLLAQIVGFRIEIERLEGKWKLNQNHSAERRERVVRVLKERTDENSRAIAALMEMKLSLYNRELPPGQGSHP